MENKKLEELENILENAPEVSSNGPMGIIIFSRGFNATLVKKVKNEKYVISFDNISHLVDTWSHKMNTEQLEKFKSSIIAQAEKSRINLNNELILSIAFS